VSSHEATEQPALDSGGGRVGARGRTSGEAQQAEPQAMVCEKKARTQSAQRGLLPREGMPQKIEEEKDERCRSEFQVLGQAQIESSHCPNASK
jgi:hypothetical protein